MAIPPCKNYGQGMARVWPGHVRQWARAHLIGLPAVFPQRTVELLALVTEPLRFLRRFQCRLLPDEVNHRPRIDHLHRLLVEHRDPAPALLRHPSAHCGAESGRVRLKAFAVDARPDTKRRIKFDGPATRERQ